jgi:uncharacterized protein (TIGR04222 family)
MNQKLGKMNAQQLELYKRIQSFSLDQPHSQLSFSKRLARDNGWSINYAQRVIAEYKKFTFLAVVAGHPVTPSDQIDQAWHLHLTYTQSYWQEFCPNVLQTPLHHNPTRGCESEQIKFDDWYSRTLESYKQFFGSNPASDIWPDSQERFSRDRHFVRINTQQNWLIPKQPWLSPSRLPYRRIVSFLLILVVTFATTGCSVSQLASMSGQEFLDLYVVLLVVVLFFAYRLRAYLCLPNGNPSQKSIPLNPYQLAYLNRGKDHVIDTAIASLAHQGYLRVDVSLRKLTLENEDLLENLSDPIEKEVAMAIALDGYLDVVRKSAISTIDTIQTQLLQFELLVSEVQASKVRTYPVFLTFPLLGLGIARILLGISRGRPIGILLFMCIVLVCVQIHLYKSSIHRSRYGDKILKHLHNKESIKKLDSQTDSLPMAFALWGTLALPNDMFDDLKKIFIPIPSSDTSSDSYISSDSDSGSGCSGCGGCGGCGGGD